MIVQKHVKHKLFRFSRRLDFKNEDLRFCVSFWFYDLQVITIERLLLNFSDLNYFRSSNFKDFSSGVSYSLRVATLLRVSRVAFYGLQFFLGRYFMKALLNKKCLLLILLIENNTHKDDIQTAHL